MKKILFVLFLIISLPIKSEAQCYNFTVQTTSQSCPGCCDGTATITILSGGCPPYNITWYPGLESTPTITSLCSGTYSVILMDSGCCPDTMASCCLDCTTTSINYSSPLQAIKSNITEDYFLIINNLKYGEVIELYDLSGREIFNMKSSNASEKINLAPLIKQIYILIVTDKEQNIIFRKKIVW